jgi:hypothetical protein
MATAGNLCTTIIGDLSRSDTSLSDIVLIDIKSAIRDYEAYRFYFNERKLSITLSLTNTYALQLWTATDATLGDIIEVDNMTVLVNSGTRRYLLKEIAYNTMRDNDYGPGLPTGNPERYALFGQSIVLDTFPTPAITGTIDCHVKFADLALMSDSNVWTNDASELIRNAALKRLWGRRFKDMESAQSAAVGEQAALAALQRRTDGLSGGVVAAYL